MALPANLGSTDLSTALIRSDGRVSGRQARRPATIINTDAVASRRHGADLTVSAAPGHGARPVYASRCRWSHRGPARCHSASTGRACHPVSIAVQRARTGSISDGADLHQPACRAADEATGGPTLMSVALRPSGPTATVHLDSKGHHEPRQLSRPIAEIDLARRHAGRPRRQHSFPSTVRIAPGGSGSTCNNSTRLCSARLIASLQRHQVDGRTAMAAGSHRAAAADRQAAVRIVAARRAGPTLESRSRPIGADRGSTIFAEHPDRPRAVRHCAATSAPR